MFKRKPSNNARIETLIGARTRVRGDVEFAGGLHVDGHIHGDVTGEPGQEAVLSVSETGCIEGSVAASSVHVNGLVKGDIDASGRVELGERAAVLGNVRYRVIETAVGAQINGKLIHAPERAPEPAAPSGEGGITSAAPPPAAEP
jgi:cytoskeletal protein CcmA (bactofilin family)